MIIYTQQTRFIFLYSYDNTLFTVILLCRSRCSHPYIRYSVAKCNYIHFFSKPYKFDLAPQKIDLFYTWWKSTTLREKFNYSRKYIYAYIEFGKKEMSFFCGWIWKIEIYFMSKREKKRSAYLQIKNRRKNVEMMRNWLFLTPKCV